MLHHYNILPTHCNNCRMPHDIKHYDSNMRDCRLIDITLTWTLISIQNNKSSKYIHDVFVSSDTDNYK